MRTKLSVTVALLCSTGAFAIDSTYIGRDGGSWNVTSNWSPRGVPDNGANTYHAIINSGVTVFLNLTLDLDRLSIGDNDTLSFLNDVDLYFASSPITNDGLIHINAAGNNTDLVLNTPDLFLIGSGEVRLQGPNARIYGINANRRLTNDFGHLITGGGQIGVNNALLLDNEGVIEANQATPMTIDLVGGVGSNHNSGVIRAASGGKVQLLDTTIDNLGGLFLAQTGSTVDVINSHIVNGIFDVEGTGAVRVTGSSTFTNPTNNGLIDVLNDVDPLIEGSTFTNTGELRFSAGGNSTDLRLNAPDVTFTGGGVLAMGNSPNNRIYGINANRRLINAADHLIRGSGQIGVNSALFLTNHGVIRADQANDLTIDLVGSTADNFNNNLLEADGANLNISATEITNNGMIRAMNAGNVNISASGILGGLLNGDSGLIRVTGSSTFIDVTTNGTFQVLNDVDPVVVGTITNLDEIQMLAGGNNTDLRLDSPDVTLTGGGELAMSDSPNNRIYGLNANRRLINASGHLIRGSGQIGVNSALFLTNNGVIRADQINDLTIDLVGSTANNFNNNLLEADGANLNLSGTEIDNSVGTIHATNGGNVNIAGSSILGGLLDGDDGLIRATASSTFTNITVDGTLQVLNDVDPVVLGTITNLDVIQMLASGNSTDLRLDSTDVTFTGGGVLAMSDSPNNRIYGINANRRLVNAADHLIRGSGQIGVNSALFLTNGGIIRADQANTLTLDLVGSVANNFNVGLLEASNANLTILNTEIDNTGGTIHAANAGFVDINGTLIFGGTLDTTGSGRVRCTASSTFRDVTNTGLFETLNDVDPVLEGTFTNNGEMQVNAGGGSTDLRINSDPVLLAGGGQLVFSNSSNNRIYGINAVRRLINGSEHTIRGTAQIGVNSAFNLTNQGSIIADLSGGITIDVSGDFDNQGFLHANEGDVVIAPGVFTTSGSIIVDPGHTLTRNGDFNQTDGISLINGVLTVNSGGIIDLDGGVFGGNGVVNGNVANSAGSVAPGSSAGDLNVNGTYTQGANGDFTAEIGGPTPGTQHDQLIVSGSATLGGNLTVARINGFQPTLGQEFTIRTASTRIGTFNTVFSCDPVEVIYTDTSVKVVFGELSGIVGDLTGNGMVDGADLGLLLASWGNCVETCCDADLDGDLDVDGADLGLLLANWS